MTSGSCCHVEPGPLLVGRRHAAFELRGPVNLSGDQDAAVREQGRVPAFDHREALALQGPLAQRGQFPGVAAGNRQAPARPDPRVDHHRQRPRPAPAGQPGQAPGVIEVPVAEDHRLDLGQVDVQPPGVGDHRVGGEPGVEKQRGRRGAAPHGDQRRKSVLGQQPDRRDPVLELRRLGHAGAEGCSRAAFIVRQQAVVHVVDEGGDHDLVDRLQRYRVDGRPGGGARDGPGDLSAIRWRVTHQELLSLRGPITSWMPRCLAAT